MLSRFLKIIGLDKPFDESRRAAIATVGKAALYPVLNSVVPEVLSEPQYSDAELALAEKLYTLAKEIRRLKINENRTVCSNLYSKYLAQEPVDDLISQISANRKKLDSLCSEFDNLSNTASKLPNLIGWKKSLFPDSPEKVVISSEGVLITKVSVPNVIIFEENSRVTPYIYNDISISEFAATDVEIHETIESVKELAEHFRESFIKAKQKEVSISLYSLCHTGERAEFSFEQDSKSWREKLKQDHDEYQGRY